MIRGYFAGHPGRRRPVVAAQVVLGEADRSRDVHFIVDTGADRSLLALPDAEALGLDILTLPTGRSLGVGGLAATALADVTVALGEQRLKIAIRILVPSGPAEQARQRRIPSVVGRDVLSHFGLFIEERRDLVILLEPGESEQLNLPDVRP